MILSSATHNRRRFIHFQISRISNHKRAPCNTHALSFEVGALEAGWRSVPDWHKIRVRFLMYKNRSQAICVWTPN